MDAPVHDQAAHLRELAGGRLREGRSSGPGSGCRVIAVTSGKGGVGKTNLAVNLGIALSNRGLRTAVLDADLGLANVDVVLGISPKHNLSHVLLGQQSLEDVICEGPAGLKIVAGGSGIYEMANLSEWRLRQFIASMRRLDREFDIIIVDTGAGISRNVLSFVLAVDEVMAITTPEPTALTDVYSMMKLIFGRNPETSLKLVINMVKDSRDAESACRKLELVVEKFLGTRFEYLGFIPTDSCVVKAVKRQEPVVLAYPGCAFSKATFSIADALEGGNGRRENSGIGGLFTRMAELLKRG